jgi:O-antigen/teichoic acid export membrane protein
MVVYQKKIEGGTEELGSLQAKVASSVMVAKILTLLFAGGSFIIVARLLGPDYYGAYTAALAFSSIFVAFSDFGISQTLVRFLGEYSHNREFKEIGVFISNELLISIITSGLLTLAAIFFAGPAVQYSLHNLGYKGLFVLAAFGVLLSSIWNLCYSMLIGLGKGKQVALVVALQVGIQAVTSVAFAMIGYGAFAPMLGFLLGMLAGAWTGLALLKRMKIRIGSSLFSVAKLKEILKFSLPLGAANTISGSVANFSIIVLGTYTTAVVLGNFGLTYKVSSMLEVIVGSIGVSLIPLFAAALSDKKIKREIGKYYNYSIYLTFLLITPVLLYIAVLSQQFSYTVFGASYSLAPIYISIMAIGVLINIVGGFTSNLMISANQTMRYLKYWAVLSAVQLVLLYLIVPTYTGMGLALIVFIIIPALQSIVFVRRVQMLFKTHLELGKLARVIVAGVISAALILPLQYVIGQNNIPLLISVAIEQLLIYPPLLALAGGISGNEIGVLRATTKEIPVVRDIISLLTGYTNVFLRLRPPPSHTQARS